MTSNVLFGACALCFALTSPAIYGSDQPPRLTTNPFDRPAWFNDSRTVTANTQTNTPRTRIDLRATLVAGAASLASVGKTIIAIGDEIDGYRLVSVDYGRAVFSDGDDLIEVKVIGDEQDNDNETD